MDPPTHPLLIADSNHLGFKVWARCQFMTADIVANTGGDVQLKYTFTSYFSECRNLLIDCVIYLFIYVNRL